MKNERLLHGIYLALLGGLLAFFTYREVSFHRRMAYQAAVMVPIVQQLSAQHYWLSSEIEKESKDYPNPRVSAIFQKAARTDSLKTVLVAWLDSLQQTDNDPYRRTALYQYDCLARELSIPDPAPALRNQIERGTPHTARATILGLTASALSASLSEQRPILEQQLTYALSLDAMIPSVLADKPAIAGQPFIVEIFPIHYTTRRDSTSTPYVNGNAGKFERGQFHFQDTPQKSGQRRYHLSVKEKDPWADDTIVREKMTEIQVR